MSINLIFAYCSVLVIWFIIKPQGVALINTQFIEIYRYMAGHSKFKNIQHRKNAQDLKRAKVFTRLLREVSTAAKFGGTDAASNPRLRAALLSARSHNVPRDNIERAISSASIDVQDNLTEMRYEGFGHAGVAIIAEVLTDNRNRSASEIRSTFTKFGSSLGENGSVSFLFTKLGVIQYEDIVDVDKFVEITLSIPGVYDIESQDQSCTIYTQLHDYHNVVVAALDAIGQSTESYIGWIPQSKIMITDQEAANKVMRLIDALESLNDVTNVFSNCEFSDAIVI